MSEPFSSGSRLSFNVPLVNALSVNAKAAVRAVKDICETIETTLKKLCPDGLERYVRTYESQCHIRRFMKAPNVFVRVLIGSAQFGDGRGKSMEQIGFMGQAVFRYMGSQEAAGNFHIQKQFLPPRGVFTRFLRDKPETAVREIA